MFVTMQISMLIREQREINDLILDVHGHQIFINGCFNGDPHPGKAFVMITVDSLGLGVLFFFLPPNGPYFCAREHT